MKWILELRLDLHGAPLGIWGPQRTPSRRLRGLCHVASPELIACSECILRCLSLLVIRIYKV